MIAAQRNGEKRLFNEAIWANMPPDCYGWEIITTMPDSVKPLPLPLHEVHAPKKRRKK